MKTPNMSASVRARLLNLSKERGQSFDFVLNRYASERLLFRLSQSPERERFVLKGATLFALWLETPHRPTRDLDLLGYGDASIPAIETVFRSILSTQVPNDGLTFDADKVVGSLIKEDQEYEGVRVAFAAQLGTARIAVQIDVGFGDVMTPGAVEIEYPTLLGEVVYQNSVPAPLFRLRAYNCETVVAEKFEAMLKLGRNNTRLKDFFDVWILLQGPLDLETLRASIAATFSHRGTPIPDQIPIALSSEFGNEALKIMSDDVAPFKVQIHALKVSEATSPVSATSPMKITSPAKTVADCFKFRSRVGLDVALEGQKARTSKNRGARLFPVLSPQIRVLAGLAQEANLE